MCVVWCFSRCTHTSLSESDAEALWRINAVYVCQSTRGHDTNSLWTCCCCEGGVIQSKTTTLNMITWRGPVAPCTSTHRPPFFTIAIRCLDRRQWFWCYIHIFCPWVLLTHSLFQNQGFDKLKAIKQWEWMNCGGFYFISFAYFVSGRWMFSSRLL